MSAALHPWCQVGDQSIQEEEGISPSLIDFRITLNLRSKAYKFCYTTSTSVISWDQLYAKVMVGVVLSSRKFDST